MRIQLNGEPHELAGPLTISELLAQLQIEPRRVAVELNLVVLKRHAFDTTTVQDGDEIEIVNFVGGGRGGEETTDDTEHTEAQGHRGTDFPWFKKRRL